MTDIEKQLSEHFAAEPPGSRTNAIRWFQKLICAKAMKLPRDFKTRKQWETFREKMRSDLRRVIGIPAFPQLKDSLVRGRFFVGGDVLCERVDVHVDENYAIPAFVYQPAKRARKALGGLVWSPGFGQDKWNASTQALGCRLAKQGFVTLVMDHAPFGETTGPAARHPQGMTLVMGMGQLLGISQLALRAAETMRCGEYLRQRDDVDPSRVAVAGLCQGGMDTYLAGALDEQFCAVAPICAASTFAVVAAEMASYWAWSDSSPFPFGILDVCDAEHLYAAVAPRPLLVRANLPDQWWPVSGLHDIETFARKIYRLYDAEDRIDFRAEVHVHDISGPFADALEAFLIKYVREKNRPR